MRLWWAPHHTRSTHQAALPLCYKTSLGDVAPAILPLWQGEAQVVSGLPKAVLVFPAHSFSVYLLTLSSEFLLSSAGNNGCDIHGSLHLYRFFCCGFSRSSFSVNVLSAFQEWLRFCGQLMTPFIGFHSYYMYFLLMTCSVISKRIERISKHVCSIYHFTQKAHKEIFPFPPYWHIWSFCLTEALKYLSCFSSQIQCFVLILVYF